MSGRFRFNSLAIIALAVLFYLFFMAAKHDPALSAVNAFAEDPYDAIGTFGIQAAAFLGILSLIRAFRPHPGGTPSDERKVFLARTQMLAVLAVVITLVSDGVAMLRYMSMWTGSPGGAELAALLGGLAFLAIVVGALVYRNAQETHLEAMPNPSKKSMIVSLAAILILAFYPESIRQSTFGALFTVLVGAVLLFAPLWAFGMSLVPHPTEPQPDEAAASYGWLKRSNRQLGFVALLGVLMGLVFVLGESTEAGAGPHLSGLAFAASVYIGLETAGLLIGYAFLRKSLGLFQ